jgi:hypothetical protein
MSSKYFAPNMAWDRYYIESIEKSIQCSESKQFNIWRSDGPRTAEFWGSADNLVKKLRLTSRFVCPVFETFSEPSPFGARGQFPRLAEEYRLPRQALGSAP